MRVACLVVDQRFAKFSLSGIAGAGDTSPARGLNHVAGAGASARATINCARGEVTPFGYYAIRRANDGVAVCRANQGRARNATSMCRDQNLTSARPSPRAAGR